MKTTPLLDSIDSPQRLRRLEREDLPQVAQELRDFMLHSVAQTGGHLSSNLGTVELTVALHYVFNTPEDAIVWDVGHQTYPHKILTGRREAMQSLRQEGGLSGFPRRSESPFDAFGTAHSSTSISAALGMAIAFKQQQKANHAIAVIGDGAMTAGMAFEAMNNVKDTGAKLLVILNDNDMSISAPVGALNNYLAKLLSGRVYSAVRKGGERVLGVAPGVLEFARRWEEHMKGMLIPGTLFEEFGFNYIGPIDGHDLDVLVSTLSNLKALDGPQFLHVITKKGKGYPPAEADPILYHGVSRFDPAVGILPKAVGKLTYTQVFGQWLCDMAKEDPRLIGITPAMCEGSGLVEFSKAFKERYFDVGIAEQHAVTFAAGMATQGLKPVVAIYSTFLQRAYDQWIHDVVLQNLPVMLAVDRAGLVGADGATHAGSFDFTYLRCLPNTVVMAPANENECRQMLTTAYRIDGPTAVRYPRGSGPGVKIDPELTSLPIGKAEIRRRGQRIALLAFGSMVNPAEVVGDHLDATVVNMRFVRPMDEDLIESLAKTHSLLVTIEENVIKGGAGSGVAEVLASKGLSTPLLMLGLPDHFIDHGDPVSLLKGVGLDATGIERTIRARLETETPVLHRADHRN